MTPIPLCEATTERHSRGCSWSDDEGNWWNVLVVGDVAYTLVRYFRCFPNFGEGPLYPPLEWDEPNLHPETSK